MDPKCSQNGPKVSPGGVLGHPWATHRCLYRFWSWFWTHFESIWGPCWHPKSILFLIEIETSFFIDFEAHVGPFWRPKVAILVPKTDLGEKRWMFKNIDFPIVKPYFLRFWEIKNTLKSTLRAMRKPSGFSNRFLSDFGAFLEHFWGQKWYQKGVKHTIDFLIDFWRKKYPKSDPRAC